MRLIAPPLVVLALAGCGGARLQDIPPTERAPICRQLNAAPTGTFGCTADQVAGFNEPGGKRYAVDLHFGADGRLDKFTDLHEVRAEVADQTAPAPDCVDDEIRAWRLEGLKGSLVLPAVLVYEGAPAAGREAQLEGPACRVRITFETR